LIRFYVKWWVERVLRILQCSSISFFLLWIKPVWSFSISTNFTFNLNFKKDAEALVNSPNFENCLLYHTSISMFCTVKTKNRQGLSRLGRSDAWPTPFYGLRIFAHFLCKVFCLPTFKLQCLYFFFSFILVSFFCV